MGWLNGSSINDEIGEVIEYFRYNYDFEIEDGGIIWNGIFNWLASQTVKETIRDLKYELNLK